MEYHVIARAFVDQFGPDPSSCIKGVCPRLVYDPVMKSPTALCLAPDYGGAGYVYTPSTMFADYAAQETTWHIGGMAAWSMKMATPAIRGLVRFALDGHVQLNGWGVSTQLTDVSPDRLDQAVAAWQEDYPGVPIVLRSVNPEINPDLWDKGIRLPSRQVWLWNEEPTKRRRPDYWRDKALLDEPGWTWREGATWDNEDFEAAARFYEALYIQKYTPLNPWYTAAGLRAYHTCGLARYWMLEHEGVRVGFVGMIENQAWMTTPFIGPNPDVDPQMKAFRRLVAFTFSRALESGKGLHLSAGASRFKELRGARPVLEASLVLGDVSKARGLALRGMARVLSRLAPSLIDSRY